MIDLIELIIHGRAEKLKQALRSNLKQDDFDLDIFVYAGMSLLHLAVFREELEAIKVLLELGVDPNLLVGFEDISEKDVDLEVVNKEYIIDNSILDELDNLGNVTPLHMAVKKNNYAITKLLLNYNVMPDQKDQGGCTALHWAVSQKNIDLVKLLIQNNANVNCTDLVNNTPLHEAARRNNQEIFDILLSNNADTSIKDVFGKTAAELLT